MLSPARIASLLFFGSTLLLTACSGGSGSAGGTQRSNGALLLTVTTADALTANLMLPTTGAGTLDVAHAWFHVGRVELSLESKDTALPTPDHAGSDPHGGHDGDGDDQDGDDDDDPDEQHGQHGHDDDGDDDHEHGKLDTLVVDGPFTFDAAAGRTVIESVSVPPGTIRRAVLALQTTGDQPFDGNSIVLDGTYRNDNGDRTPFTLRSTFAGNLQVPIANGGIVVDANVVVPVELMFDLAALLAGLDFGTAMVEDGEIRIDATHNVQLLMAFVLGLQGCVGAHERDD